MPSPRRDDGLRIARCSFSRARAFTLVELLVVVAIIVILIAILIPSMEQAVAEAQRAKCLANLKGVGLALRFYANDNGGYIPPYQESGWGPAPNGKTMQDHSWFWYPEWIEKYSANREIYKCPNDYGFPAGGTITQPLHSYDKWDHVSYYLNTRPDQYPSLSKLKAFTLPQPQKTVLICDWSGMVGFSWHKPRLNVGAYYNDAQNNYAFLDGHAATVNTYWVGGWAWDYAPPTNYEYMWLAP